MAFIYNFGSEGKIKRLALSQLQVKIKPFFTPIDGFIAIFAATAGIGGWAAYNREAARIKLALILGAIFIFYILAHTPEKHLWIAANGLSLLAALLGAYFLLSHNWNAVPAGIRFIDQIGASWMQRRPYSAPPLAHPNQIAGILASLTPFLLAGIYRTKRLWLIITAVAVGLALFMTGSRGAWLALLGGLGLWGSYHALKPNRRAMIAGMTLLALFILATTYFAPAVITNLIDQLPGVSSSQSRLEIYQNSANLAADYWVIGGGLAGFAGIYSHYILHMPFEVATYAHNLYLDLLIEQGILGLTAWLGIFGSAISLLIIGRNHSDSTMLLRNAILISIFVIFAHGLVDDALYGGLGTLLLFVPPGIAVAISLSYKIETASTSLNSKLGSFVFLLIPFIFGLLLLLLPAGRAALHANLGAIEMGRVELAAFPSGEWDSGENLLAYENALFLLNRSIHFNANNATAHYRLGLLAMLYRNYDIAVVQLAVASKSRPHHAGITKALAYSYLWAGQSEQALPLLAQLPESESELRNYIGWWQAQGRTDFAGLAAEMSVQLSSIDN